MKKFFTKSVTLLALLLTLGVGNVWGWNLADGRKVYFNMQNQTGFGTPYFRIGRHEGGDWSAATAMTNVPGTKYLYIHTQSGTWSNYGAFSVADGKGFTDGNNIFQPWSGQPGSEGYSGDVVISKQIFFQKYDVTSDCYLEIKSANGSESNGCQYYDVNAQTSDDGGSLVTDIPMYSVTFNSSPSHGAVAVQKYTQTDGSTKESISSNDEVYPTQIIEITTTPDSYYVLDKLTVTGATLISGTTYYVTGDCEITATFAPQWSINGTMSDPEWDIYNGMTFVSGHTHRGKIILSGQTAYKFKVLDRSTTTWYGCGTRDHDYTYVGQTDAVPISTSPGYNVMLLTTQAGEYTFEWTDDTHTLKILYPKTVSHPSLDYVYMERYSDWNSENKHCYIHYFYTDGSGDHPLTTWGEDDAKITAYTTIGGTDYYYFPILDDYPKFVIKNNVGNETDDHKTGDMVSTDHEGQCTYYKDATEKWTWKGLQVHIAIDDRSATTHVNPTYFDIDYNSAVLTDLTSTPLKNHYDFGGFYTNSDGTGTQVIDDAGQWIAPVSGYTDASKHWIHPGCTTTVYAKWTETSYTITMAVSPAGAGTTSPASTATGKLVTESGDITATPAAGYKFKEWQFSQTDEAYDAWCADGYSSTDATIHIKAQHNGTLTAVFEERYSLVGSLQDNSGNGGMPGWEDYTKTFTVNSSSPVDLTRTCTLQADKTYKLQVHDLATGTNLGRSGCDPVCVLEENASLVMENSNNDVFLYTSGAGEYIFKITAVDGSGHPTLTVLRPYPVNFGQKYQDIDGTLHAGTTGGTASASAGSALTSGDYVTYNTSVTHTATAESGYTFAGWWSSDAFEGEYFSNVNPMTYAVTRVDNTYAKFTEDSKSVTISKTGNGTITVGGSNFIWGNTTTCGVTTTRRLVATGDPGYRLSSWTVPDGVNFQLEDKASDTDNDVTLRGKASGSAGTLTANFTERYSIKGTMNGEDWGTTHTLSNIGTNAGSKDTCYVTMTLPANTTYEFAIYDEQTGGWLKNSTTEVFNMTYTNHTNWGFGTDKTVNCGITTAGKGTYKFIFNITDKTVTVVYPASWQVNYGASVGGSVTSVVDGDSNPVPNGGYVVAGGSVTYTAAANSGYTFVGWCNTDSYGDTFTNINPWTNSSIAAESNAYAKFKSTNFVIYRTGDKSDDPRAAFDDVESYGGGTISETIEFRMKVHQLDYWYTLCLPFTVSAVKVWDDEDGEYYDIEPYYRDGSYHGGHYIIRTPESTTNFALANFGNWNDPNSSSYKPEKNKPYIIQWHNSYFLNKYISFFGATGQTIPSFSAGEAPSSNDVVNVYGNNSMTSGSVTGAYLLEADYGPSGAWLRAEEPSASRTILPFECYILANNATTTKYKVLHRDMTIDDTPTGFPSVTEDPALVIEKVLIDGQIYIFRGENIYTIQGILVKGGK